MTFPPILPVADLPALGASCRAAGLAVVWTNGVFDLLHAGHGRSLAAAADLGDVLVVGVNSDASVRRLKGPRRPIIGEADRAELVASLARVDHVVIFGEDDPRACISLLRPAVVCKGEDYAARPMPERGTADEVGARVAYLPVTAGLSTTEIIRRVRAT